MVIFNALSQTKTYGVVSSRFTDSVTQVGVAVKNMVFAIWVSAFRKVSQPNSSTLTQKDISIVSNFNMISHRKRQTQPVEDQMKKQTIMPAKSEKQNNTEFI